MQYAKDKTELGKMWGKVKSAMSGKVDKQKDKGLSTNDFTNEDKEKLEAISSIVESEIDNLFIN